MWLLNAEMEYGMQCQICRAPNSTYDQMMFSDCTTLNEKPIDLKWE